MEDHITPLKTGLKYGAYLGIASIVLTLVEHYVGWQDLANPTAPQNWISSVLSIIIGLVVVYLGIKYYRGHNEGLLTFGEGISVSLFIGLFAGVLIAIFMYIFAAYIDPDLGAEIISNIDTDEMSENEADAMEQAMGWATSPTFLAFTSFITSIISALIYGLIGSAILKKDR